MARTVGFILVAALILLYATVMLVGIPSLQLKTVKPPEVLEDYTEIEKKGRSIYVSNGCVYCHSQQPRAANMGPDGERGWGRPSTPGDYYFDYPHLLGSMRTGPDLFNIGSRQPSEDWHLIHLYQPRSVLPKSVMPAYPYLFELKKEADPSDKVVNVPEQFAPKGQVVVATEDALALVSYLQSLDHTYKTEALKAPSTRKESTE